MYRLNFKVIPIGSDGPVVAPFFFLSPSRFSVDSFKGSENQIKVVTNDISKSTIFFKCLFYELTHKSDFELPTLAECSIKRANFASAERDFESNEALQVRLLLEHVLSN